MTDQQQLHLVVYDRLQQACNGCQVLHQLILFRKLLWTLGDSLLSLYSLGFIVEQLGRVAVHLTADTLAVLSKFAADFAHERYENLRVKEHEIVLLFDIEGFNKEPVVLDHVLVTVIEQTLTDPKVS